MRFLRFILLFSCFSLLLNSDLSAKTGLNSRIVKTTKKEKTESTCIPSPDAENDALLSRLPQINFTFFKTSRQNQFLAVQSLPAELISLPEKSSNPEKNFSKRSIRLHLAFCVMRC